MADEGVITQGEPIDTPTGEQPQEKQYSKVETQALEMGWRPQEEWTGDPDDFVSAKEYVARKSFFDKIAHQSKEIKELKATLGEFSEHFRKVEDYTRKQVLEELKAAKKAALEAGDPDEVIRIDEAITDFKVNEKELEAQKKAKEEQPKSGELNPVYVSWKAKNSWYQADPKMTQFADKIAIGYRQLHPDSTPEQVLAEIETEVRERFPDKFKNPARSKPAAVEQGSSAPAKKPAKLDATPEELAVARKFVRQGVYASEDDYIKILRKMGSGE